MKSSRDIARLIEVMAALRTPVTGCPWDLQQDFASSRLWIKLPGKISLAGVGFQPLVDLEIRDDQKQAGALS